MRGLNPDHLRTLSEVLAQASFTRAARRLNLAQPTVSLQVRELEMRLGVRLIDRLGKRAFATAAGRELLEHARRLLGEEARLLAAMRRHREGWLGQVRIGSSTTALIYHLPPLLQQLRLSQPNIELIVTTGTTNSIVERIIRNEIDVGIVSLPVADRVLAVEPLLDEPLVAIFSADQRALPAHITPGYLLKHPLLLEFARAHVRAMIIDWLSVAGVEARPAMELDNLEAVKRMVAAGLGASIVPLAAVSRENARHDLVARPLRPGLTRTLALIQRRDRADDAALREVRTALRGLKSETAASSSRA
jgi:DNA-binding transcriptional LysR family regulator